MDRRVLISGALILILAGTATAGNRVKGHYRDTDGDGYKETHVNPYYRSGPDGNKYNNYSSQGNYNPYTGERGSVNPNGDYNSTPNSYYKNNRNNSYYGK